MNVKYVRISASFHNTPLTAQVKLPAEDEFTASHASNLVAPHYQTSVPAEVSSTVHDSTEEEYDAFDGKKYDLTKDTTLAEVG